MLFTQDDVIKKYPTQDLDLLNEKEGDNFVALGEFSEPLEFSFSGDNDIRVIFNIQYWLDSDGELWFNFTSLYNGLSKWLSTNHPDPNCRDFWRSPNRWFSLSPIRKEMFSIFSVGFYPDTATYVLSYNLISYQFLAKHYPDHCKVKGRVRSAAFFTDQKLTMVLIRWLSIETGFDLADWFTRMIKEVKEKRQSV